MSSKLKTAFVGCSMTLGDGFDPDDRPGHIYPSLVSTKFMLDHDNLSVSGASNHMIFLLSANAIRSKKYDIVFCQWTALNRLWLSPGPNTWFYATGDAKDSFDYRDYHLDHQSKHTLENQIKILNHDYQNIIELIDYVSILEDLAQLHNIKLIHINGMVPWQSDLLDIDALTDFTKISNYTKEILDFDNRDDGEIHSLLHSLQQKFAELNTKNWINLFDSFQTNSIDLGPQGHHPGPKSHQHMAEQIHNYLIEGNL